MIRVIAAVSKNGIIGKDNALPFDYPEDLKWFKQSTVDSVIIMGRKTFEGIGRPLPNRENIVITSSKLETPGITCFSSIESFFNREQIILRDRAVDYWFIGGAGIYEEGMNWAQEIYLTLTPDTITGEGVVRFPWINPLMFNWVETTPLHMLVNMSHESELKVLKYVRRT